MAINNCYIHIPFCDNICSYCDFCKILNNSSIVDKYLDELENEIKSLYNGEKLDTIYIGGGTPSCLNINQLEKLFSIISVFNRSCDCSITIENNFSSTTYQKLDLYKKYGVNRLSFGIESIDDDNLKLLERSIDKKQVNEIINYSKSIGFDDINIDLIYAIPGEDILVLDKDINYVLSLDVSHISTYSLIIENNTKLKINNIKNVSEDLDYEMYNYISQKLESSGYIHYEISNFSKPSYYSKHNLCYWKNKNYYGFGLGASSYIKNTRYTNTRSINKYLNGNYIKDKEILSEEDIIEYEIILNLRLSRGINLFEFKKKFGIELHELYNYKLLVDENLLKKESNNLYIPSDKLYISNEIIVKLLQNKL